MTDLQHTRVAHLTIPLHAHPRMIMQLKDEVRQEVREEVDTKVKQDQLDEVKALLRALAQLTQVSSSATTPQVDGPPTDDPTTDDPPIGDM